MENSVEVAFNKELIKKPIMDKGEIIGYRVYTKDNIFNTLSFIRVDFIDRSEGL